MTLNNPTSLLSNQSAADLAVYTTASCTPVLGSRFFVIVTSGLTNASVVPTSVSHAAVGALTLVTSRSIASGTLTISVWTGVGTGAAGAITITHSSVMGNCCWHVSQFTSTVNTPTVAQFATQASSGTAIGATLSTSPASTSCVVGAVAANTTTDVPTLGSGFTTLNTRQAVTTPANSLTTEYDNGSPPSQAPFTFTGAQGKALITFEVADGIAASKTAKYWNGTTEVSVTLSRWNGTTEDALTLV